MTVFSHRAWRHQRWA